MYLILQLEYQLRFDITSSTNSPLVYSRLSLFVQTPIPSLSLTPVPSRYLCSVENYRGPPYVTEPVLAYTEDHPSTVAPVSSTGPRVTRDTWSAQSQGVGK